MNHTSNWLVITQSLFFSQKSFYWQTIKMYFFLKLVKVIVVVSITQANYRSIIIFARTTLYSQYRKESHQNVVHAISQKVCLGSVFHELGFAYTKYQFTAAYITRRRRSCFCIFGL